MNKKILLLGHSGKMGTALKDILEKKYKVACKNSKDFDAANFDQVRSLIEKHKPDIVINTVALLGIDTCEKEPKKALKLNTLFPKLLAELSKEKDFLLVHFSTDAVFDGKKKDFYTEKDTPRPLNKYGLTKHQGDCFIQKIAKRYYIFRISILFGKSKKGNQFVETMLNKIKKGGKVLRLADDIVLSPTYSKDVAKEVARIIEDFYPYGLYHLVNEGKGSLCELMREIVKNLNLNCRIEKASYKEFPFIGEKNTYTPLKSDKVLLLRPWTKAVADYCNSIKIAKKV